MKATAVIVGSFVLVLALLWALGLVEFTYPRVVANQPLRNPRSVVRVEGTNMVLGSGQLITLSARYGSGPVSEEEISEISNQVARTGFKVDVEPRVGHQVTLYVLWPRKFRDS